jgi:hypothetical protein
VSELVRRNPCDEAIARNVAARALIAVELGFGVRRVSAVRDGNVMGVCAIEAPRTRSAFQNVIDECVIVYAGRVSCLVGNDREDTARLSELAASVASSDHEAQALLDFAYERAVSLVDHARTSGMIDKFVGLLDGSGGELDCDRDAVRDYAPLFDVRSPPITVNMPAPIVNVTLPEQQPPTVNVEVPAQPDKIVRFTRDGNDQIVEAETSPVAA